MTAGEVERPKGGLLYYIWILFLLAVMAVGAFGMFIFFTQHSVVLEATSEIAWGLLIAAYVFFVVLSTGCCIISSIGNSFRIQGFKIVSVRATYVAIITLLCGYIPLMAHLGHLERMGNFLLTPNFSSLMWWMATFYFLYVILEIAEFWVLIRWEMVKLSKATSGIKALLYRIWLLGSKDDSERSLKRDLNIAQLLGYIALIFALSAHFTLGSIFASTEAKAMWYGSFLPLNFLLSGFRAGIAITILAVVLTYWVTKKEISLELKDFITGPLRKLFAFLLAFATIYYAWLIAMSVLHLETYYAWTLLLTGPYMLTFWVVQVGLGKITPLLILIYPKTGRSLRWVSIASFIFLIGSFTLRYQWTIVGQVVPPIGQVAPAVPPLVTGLLMYTPSVFEIFVVAGALAACLLLYTLGDRYFPLHIEHP